MRPILSLLLALTLSAIRLPAGAAPAPPSSQTQACLACHDQNMPGLTAQWRTSHHAADGVGCWECHQAETGDADALAHNGHTIAVIVSPRDCAGCHAEEAEQFADSHHSRGGLILGSLDNFLADIVEGDWAFHGGSALTASGCAQCHGSEVKVLPGGKLRSDTWPNSGIGRFNPDGSMGSCSACHQRHTFSAAQARRPETCGKCHMGPDHPQKEVYEESKHGIAFAAHEDEVNLDSDSWVLGQDYTAAPTCATCHMSAARAADGKVLPATHDVGRRLSWNNRPALSVRPEIADKKLGLKLASMPWTERRAEMQQVCANCHAPGFMANFYEQYDGVIALYNGKFAGPGDGFMKLLYQEGLITETQFDEPVEWTWWEIWHHEGRRARHGVSMQGPDYTHWHGMYEVAKHFYTKFIPELQEIARHHLASNDPAKVEAAATLDTAVKELLSRPEHAWFTGNLAPEEKARRKQAQEEFIQRYTK
ncbi:MAG: hydroxylamine oxidoreductase [Candidatus Zixiibacteriota bacterium]|nr:MAG: hydroxylamine oxidoreductase [candidate division Zixibacteria bacterium]